MSKMREALEDAYIKGANNPNLGGWGFDIQEIAQRYGPMFTREEVRGMLEEAAAYVHYLHGAGEAVPPPPQYELEDTANRILSRHLGESESGEQEEPDIYDAVLDYRTREGMATLDDLCKRVAAIEKWLLADGHSEGCRKGHSEGFYRVIDCTCGHDEIRGNRGR